MASGIVEPSSQGSEQNTSTQGIVQGQQAGARSQIAQRLIDAPNLPAFISELITAQATTVAGTEATGFLIERGQDKVGLRVLAHIRNDESDEQTRSAAVTAFQELVRPCIQQAKDGAIDLGMTAGDSIESQFCLITLLRNEGEIVAVSAVIARCRDVERAKQRLNSMQLVAGYFELFTLRRSSEQARLIAQSHQHVLQLSTSVATAEGFASATMGLCNELATRAHASRVSLGWLKGRNIRVKALSHTEEFDKKQELIVQLERVMEECADQDDLVQFDPNGERTDNVTRDAAALSRVQGGNAVLSLPLRRRDEVIGVVTLEFPTGKLGPNVASALAVAVDLLAPQLYDRYQNDRWLITKVGLSTREAAKMLIGPRHMLGKLVGVLVAVAIVLLFVIRPMYHVSAPFQFAPQSKFALCAPYDGRIVAIGTLPNGERVRPGDKVRKGTVLLELDSYDKKIELAKAMAQANAKAKEAAKYRAEDKTAEEKMALDERDEAQAEADYLQYQIDHAKIVAPQDLEVLKGDFEDKQNATVKTGDVLFELGDPDDLRAELSVADRDVQDIRVGSEGRLATNALPDDKYDLVVQRIVPLPDPKEGANSFRVYGTVKARHPGTWRPGMSGEARVNVAKKPLAWIWTHRLIDFLKLKLWI